jgi:hypothetical protein
MGEENESRVGTGWMQVAASALAAVSSAVLLSTLGVAGTLIGAALGSVVATIGTSLYTRTLDVSRQQVAAQAAALRRVTSARTELDEVVSARRRGEAVSETQVALAGQELDEAEEVLTTDEAPSTPGVRRWEWPPQLSWRRLAVLAAAVFVVAMATITAFELTTGQAVSVYTGGSDRKTGSTVPGLGSGGDRKPTPTDGATPEDPAGEPDESEPPSDTATEEPTEPTEPTDPTGEPSDVPSEEPAPSPSLDPTPSPSPSLPSSDPSATAPG